MDINLNVADFSTLATNWLVTHGLAIVVIIVLAIVAHRVARIFIDRLIRKIVRPGRFSTPQAEKAREDTLIRISYGTLHTILWVVTILMVLSEVGVNIGPLLAAAGVAGLAIGFGGQYLIRDVVAGLFIILENQYRVGDVVCLDDTCGLVEDISIRMATLRDLDGAVHHVPHGTTNKVSNLSKEFARVNMDIGVSYDSNMETVIKTVNKVGEKMADDPQWKEDIIKPIAFERVDEFADSAIVIKVLGDTKPLRQWAVAGEFRKRIKIAFDKAGIEIPFPQRVLHQVKR